MFTKKDIEEAVGKYSKVFNTPKENFRVTSSGSMVLMGLKSESRDLDIEVSEELFQAIKTKFPENYKPKTYQEGHPLAPGVLELLVFETEKGDFEVMVDTLPFKVSTEVTNGISHLTKESVVEFKLWLGRDKDLKHLKDAGLI